MKILRHDVGVMRTPSAQGMLDLIEGTEIYAQVENIAGASCPLLIVCQGAVFVMPWYEVKAEFERIANWYKLESPLVKKPLFRLKVLTKPIGNEEILTALYAGI